MKKNKIPNENIILANIIYANSKNPKGIKCPFCGSDNVKEDDVHLTSFKVGGNNILRKMYICEDCQSAFSVPIFDKNTGTITPDPSNSQIENNDNYDPSIGKIDATEFFNQLKKISENQAGKKFMNLEEFVRAVDSLLCLVIFKDGTVHYITGHTTLKNIKKKLEDGLDVDAVVKFTKSGVIFIRDLLNLRDVENIRFSQLAQLIRDNILHPKNKGKDTGSKK